MQRENFRSRLGFLLVSAGCAIGIGNVWRFPYVTGQYGGGYLRSVLSHLPCHHGHSGADDGAGRGPREPEERRSGIQDAGKAGGQQVAYPRLVLHAGLLPADDVLHHRYRLDGGLLRINSLSAAFPPAWAAKPVERRIRSKCCPPRARWRFSMVIVVVAGFIDLQLRRAEGAGAHHQGDDAGAAGADSGACRPQPDCCRARPRA